MKISLISFGRLFCFGMMMLLAGSPLIAQTNALDSDHTKTISIPVTYGGFGSWEVKTVHLQRGDVLTVNVSEGNSLPVSSFQDRDNNSVLTSEIYYGDNSMSGYFDYARGWAPCCVIFSSHTIGNPEKFSYTATNIPGTAYIYFGLLEKYKGNVDVDEWLNTCIEVVVD